MFSCVCVKKGLWGDAETGEITDFGPRYMEKVTVIGTSTVYSDSYFLKEYLFDNDGSKISFKAKWFRPLSDIHSEWTEELVTELETEINQEQLIEA